MRKGDIVVSGGEAWEIVREGDEGRQIHVRLVAGDGTAARTNDVPTSFLVGKPVYRRVADLADIDAYRAGAEVARYSVDLKLVSYFPRLWVEAFHRFHPEGSRVPDGTVLLGWFANMIEAGFKKRSDLRAQKQRDKRPIKKVVKKKIAASKPKRIAAK